MAMSAQESIQSAWDIPNNPEPNNGDDGVDPTERDVQRLTTAVQLVVPSTDWVKTENDSAEPYYHIGDPAGLVDYFIEPACHFGMWEGVPNGRLGLLKPFRGPSAQAVAVMAAMAFASKLVEIAKDAGMALMSG